MAICILSAHYSNAITARDVVVIVRRRHASTMATTCITLSFNVLRDAQAHASMQNECTHNAQKHRHNNRRSVHTVLVNANVNRFHI